MGMQYSVSQGVNDISQFLSSGLNGSSRYTAMGGAFGALGGDLTAISHNPASSSVFLHSEIGGSFNFNNNSTEGSYFGTSKKDENRFLNLDHFGAVIVFNNNIPESSWTKISFGINLHKIVNFNQNASLSGSNSNGIDLFFLNYADGLQFENLPLYDEETISEAYRALGEEIGYGAQQAFLGYQSYIINPTAFEDGNTTYYSNVDYDKVTHKLDITKSGYHRKTTFNFSALYKDKLHIGINFNNHSLKSYNNNILNEGNHKTNSDTYNIKFNNELTSYGNGFSAQLGAIFKLKSIRLGATYDSPQWLNIYDETQQSVSAYHYEQGLIINERIDPKVLNIYDEYEFQIPSKTTLSFAYIFGSSGIISLDYGQQNAKNTILNRMSGSEYLDELNSKFISINTLKIGGEYRINDISLRAGFLNRNNALKNNTSKDQAYTFGIGLDFGGSSLNLALVQFKQNKEFELFSKGLTGVYNLSDQITQVSMTYNIKL
jgi:hypothetical protein